MKKPKRELILETALKLFSKNGVAHTRLLEIAKTAKVDPSLISYYFPTLDSLYVEVVRKIIESYTSVSVEMTQREPRSALKMIEVYVKSYFTWAKTHHGMFVLFLHFYHLASFKPEFAAINEVTRDTGRARIEAMIYRGIAEGDIVRMDAATVRERASQIQALIIGGVITPFTEREPDAEAAAKETWNVVLKLLT